MDVNNWLANSNSNRRSEFWEQDGMLGSPDPKKKERENRASIPDKLKKLWTIQGKLTKDKPAKEKPMSRSPPPAFNLIEPTPSNQDFHRQQIEADMGDLAELDSTAIGRSWGEGLRPLHSQPSNQRIPRKPIPSGMHSTALYPGSDIVSSDSKSDLSFLPRTSQDEESKLEMQSTTQHLAADEQPARQTPHSHSRAKYPPREQSLPKTTLPEYAIAIQPPEPPSKPRKTVEAVPNQQHKPPYNPANFPPPPPLPKHHTRTGFAALTQTALEQADEGRRVAFSKAVEEQRALLMAARHQHQINEQARQAEMDRALAEVRARERQGNGVKEKSWSKRFERKMGS